jgi:hypothetical protein
MSWAWDSGVGEARVWMDGDGEWEERSGPEEEEGGGRWELVSVWVL